jgi:putative tryptophan/tyrosine transport system substrate-binding protein
MMRRREFISLLGGAAAGWPLAARAQQAAMPVVGFLSGRSLSSDAHLVAAFRKGLSETGFVEGQNVAIEYRWAEGEFDRLSLMAADLVGRRVSMIFVGGADIRMRAITAAISMIPIVFAVAGDPVELGLVASLNRPGGNATGITLMSAELWAKRLDLLREMVGPIAAAALLINTDDPGAERSTRDVQAAAPSLGLQISVLNASAARDFEPVFMRLRQQQVRALLVTANAVFNAQREKLVALAARYAVPTIYDRREYAAAGGLISYGANNVDQYHQAGVYTGRILKGDKPADLPVMQPTKFELVINVKSAKALGLNVPDKLLALADEVIE